MADRNILIEEESPIGRLLGHPAHTQASSGYEHTLQEICQQPATWRQTAREAVAQRRTFVDALCGVRVLGLTGSGSSEYAGGCVVLGLREALRIPAESAPAALILTHPKAALPALRPGLLVSLARSGDSPESCAALEYYLKNDNAVRHLVITANREGRLAVEHAEDPRVNVFALDPRTCDRGLAMTSSFTNMVLASHFLGMLEEPERYIEIADNLARVAEDVLTSADAKLVAFAASGFTKAVYLGSGSSYHAAREGALKMLELTAGRVTTMAETPLGLRHGPMSWVDRDTAIVCFLASDPIVRAYECDLLEELDRKQIGLRRVLVGDGIPAALRTPGAVSVETAGLAAIGDHQAQIVYVLAAQLLAFFRSMEEGLKPDSPSEAGVISRVVGSFRIHTRPAGDGLQ